MVFLRILPCSRSTSGAWNKFHNPSKNVKRMKTSLVCGIFGFYTSRLQTFTMEQIDPQDVNVPSRSRHVGLSQCVPTRTKRVHLWRALTRVYDVPFWYLPTFLGKDANKIEVLPGPLPDGQRSGGDEGLGSRLGCEWTRVTRKRADVHLQMSLSRLPGLFFGPNGGL